MSTPATLELRARSVGPWPMNTYALVCPDTRASVLIETAVPQALSTGLRSVIRFVPRSAGALRHHRVAAVSGAVREDGSDSVAKHWAIDDILNALPIRTQKSRMGV